MYKNNLIGRNSKHYVERNPPTHLPACLPHKDERNGNSLTNSRNIYIVLNPHQISLRKLIKTRRILFLIFVILHFIFCSIRFSQFSLLYAHFSLPIWTLKLFIYFFTFMHYNYFLFFFLLTLYPFFYLIYLLPPFIITTIFFWLICTSHSFRFFLQLLWPSMCIFSLMHTFLVPWHKNSALHRMSYWGKLVKKVSLRRDLVNP